MNKPQSFHQFTFDPDGWCAAAVCKPSPNHNERPKDIWVDLIVIHNISLPPGHFGSAFVEDLFANQLDYGVHPYFEQLRELRVSSHFYIRRTGELIQFVSINNRAWHAGASFFLDREGCNDFSVGIELEGSDDVPFMEEQYKTLSLLTCALQTQHPLAYVAGHEHIAPQRKTDPGPYFDWSVYESAYRRLTPAEVNQKYLCFPREWKDMSSEFDLKK